MFGTKVEAPKTINSILEVFTTAKTDLETLVTETKDYKANLETELAAADSDITKGENTISKLSEILGD